MRPFDMDNILRPGSLQLPAPVAADLFNPKHLSYFSAKPYEPSFAMQTSNLTTEVRKQPDTDSNYMTGYETKRKPSRSVFAPSQIGFMEGIYHGESKTYLTADNRRQIAKKTGLSETQVKRWWQNRRQKDKNRLRDSLQSLNHFLPSMMYTCEPNRNYNHTYSDRALNDSLAHLTARRTQFLLQGPNHNIITRT
ncbi:homeobox protein Hmx-like isoform X2 [Bolinopsis microptera]|uniref:homeobox protein Hmx-like isoform X2 n=1 Tax=Bolinopsis microptera TaxID=2820187 RepID=UPI003079B24B